MSDDVKPYTREELDAIVGLIEKNEKNLTYSMKLRLLATARAGFADRARLPWSEISDAEAERVAANAVQSLADSDPDEDMIEAMDRLRGTEQESMFVVDAATLTQFIADTIKNEAFDAARGVPPAGETRTRETAGASAGAEPRAIPADANHTPPDALVHQVEQAIRLAAQLGADAFNFIEGRGLHAMRVQIEKDVAQLRGAETERGSPALRPQSVPSVVPTPAPTAEESSDRLTLLTEIHEFYEFAATDEEHFDSWLHEKIIAERRRLGLPVADGSPTPAPTEEGK